MSIRENYFIAKKRGEDHHFLIKSPQNYIDARRNGFIFVLGPFRTKNAANFHAAQETMEIKYGKKKERRQEAA